MPLAEKGVRGKGRQPLSPPQRIETARTALRSRTARTFGARELGGLADGELIEQLCKIQA
jgi:hypothetical protein